jgi:hypothetical protein
MRWFEKLAMELVEKDRWGNRIYRMDVLDDEFLHYTTRERAQQIIESGILSIDSSLTVRGVFGISLVFGKYFPRVQQTGFGLKDLENPDIVALRFKTDTIPMSGGVEEVSWLGDVRLIEPQIIELDEAEALLNAVKPPVDLDPDGMDTIIYTDKKHLEKAMRVRFEPDDGEWSNETKAHEMIQMPPVSPGEKEAWISGYCKFANIKEKFENPPYQHLGAKFIRFGKFGKTSRMGLDQEFLDEMGSAGSELGVSAYFAYPLEDKYVLIEPDRERALYGLGQDYMGHMLENVLDVNSIFLVDGDLIKRPRPLADDIREELFIGQNDLEDLEFELDMANEDFAGEEREREIERINKEIEETKYSMNWTYETGSDGEPLLMNVKVIKQLRPEDIIFDSRNPDYTLQDSLDNKVASWARRNCKFAQAEYLSLNSDIKTLSRAFDDMEGIGFFDESLDRENGSSLGDAYEMVATHEPWDDEEDPKDILMSVYGAGGFNRYLITADGSILFSKIHATLPSPDVAIDRAMALGFEVQ